MDAFELRYNCLLLAEKFMGDTTEDRFFRLAKQFADFVGGDFRQIPGLRKGDKPSNDMLPEKLPEKDTTARTPVDIIADHFFKEADSTEADRRVKEATERKVHSIELPMPVHDSDLEYFKTKIMTSAMPPEDYALVPPADDAPRLDENDKSAIETAVDSLSEKERIALYEKTKNPAFFPRDRKVYSNVSPQQYISSYMSLRAPGSQTGVQRFDLFEFQRVLVSLFANPFVLVNTARDMGMTSLTSAYALWFAMSQPNVHVIHAGHNFTLAIDIFDRTCFMFEGIASSERTPVTKRDDNDKIITFANGSTISVKAVDEHLWDQKCDLLVLHDLAYVSHATSNALYDKLDKKRVETLAKQKKHVIAYSVPSNLGGFFHRAWSDESSPWVKLELMYTRHPGRTDEWATKKREEMGEVAFRKEYMCEFEPVPDVYKLITDPEVKNILRLSGQIPSSTTNKLKK